MPGAAFCRCSSTMPKSAFAGPRTGRCGGICICIRRSPAAPAHMFWLIAVCTALPRPLAPAPVLRGFGCDRQSFRDRFPKELRRRTTRTRHRHSPPPELSKISFFQRSVPGDGGRRRHDLLGGLTRAGQFGPLCPHPCTPAQARITAPGPHLCWATGRPRPQDQSTSPE